MTILILVMAIAAQLAGQAQDQDRGIWNGEFRQQRTPVAPGEARPRGLMIGLTAWLLRDSAPGDRARLLVHGDSKAVVNLTPQRFGADTLLSEGDKVRITIESANSGYIYVVSRELYSESKHGDPYLIFPSRRIRQGRAKVVPGELVEIPEWNNPEPYLTLQRGNGETGEQIFVLLTPREIPEMMVANGPLKLASAQLDDWIQKWGTNVRMLDAPDQRGEVLTVAEKNAASQGSRLHPNDPVPQLLFRVPVTTQDSLLASYTLRLRP